jgi:hypothetical protein
MLLEPVHPTTAAAQGDGNEERQRWLVEAKKLQSSSFLSLADAKASL